MTQGNKPPLLKRGVAEKSSCAASGKLVCNVRMTVIPLVLFVVGMVRLVVEDEEMTGAFAQACR